MAPDLKMDYNMKTDGIISYITVNTYARCMKYLLALYITTCKLWWHIQLKYRYKDKRQHKTCFIIIISFSLENSPTNDRSNRSCIFGY